MIRQLSWTLLALSCALVACRALDRPHDDAAVEHDADADVEQDAERDVDVEIDPACDLDEDGYMASRCGGPDCDDSVAFIHPGAEEICNGADDDCDGENDETFTCIMATTRDCVTSCGTDGTEVCDNTCEWSTVCEPPPEACGNGIDDDCDGRVESLAEFRRPLPVWRGPAAQVTASFAYCVTRGEYGVVWSETIGSETTISFATMGLAAEEIEPHLLFDSAAASAPDLTFIWTDVVYGLAWISPETGSSQLTFARLSQIGEEFDRRVTITAGTATITAPQLSWSGDDYALAWLDDRDGTQQVYVVRISSWGYPGATQLQVSDAAVDVDAVAVTATGLEIGLAWIEGTGAAATVHFNLASADAASLVGRELVVGEAVAGGGLSLIWDGEGYGLAWIDPRHGAQDLYYARISRAGELLGERRLTAAGAAASASAQSSSGYDLNLVWLDHDGSAPVVRSLLTTDPGNPAGILEIIETSGTAIQPLSRWDEAGYGLIWVERLPYETDIIYTWAGRCL